MISFNLRSSIAIALICFILGFVSCAFLLGNCNNNEETKKSSLIIKNLEQQVKDTEAVYQKKVSELETKNRQLQKELTNTQIELFRIKLKTKEREIRIKKLVQPKGLPAKELLQKVKDSSIGINNYSLFCDSLAVEVSEYIKETAVKDSLYEMHIGLQDSVITVKDSIITHQSKLYSELKTSFSLSLEQQKNLISENQLLHKKLKRQKRRSRIISFGMMVLSGAAVNYIMNR